MRSDGNVPLIGPWIYRRSLRKTGARAIRGDCGAVSELCDVVCECCTEKTREIAESVLCSLKTPIVIRKFFEEAIVRDNPALNRIAGIYLAHPDCTEMRVLFAYATGDRQEFLLHDRSPHPILAQRYTGAGHRVRAAVCIAAKKYSWQSFLSKVIRENLQGLDDPGWMDAEWEVVLGGLMEEKQWQEIWNIVFAAPLPQAIGAFHAMNKSGWRPGGDDRHIWDTVISTLPAMWTYPIPNNNPSLTIGSGDALVTRFAFSADGMFLAAGYCDGRVEIWRVRSGTVFSSHITESGAIGLLAFSPDCCFLISGGRAVIASRNIESNEVQWEYRCGEAGSGLSVISVDGTVLAICDFPDKVTVLSLVDGKRIRVLTGFDSTITALAPFTQSPDLFIGCADGSVWSVEFSEGVVSRLLGSRGDPVNTLSAGTEGDTVFVIFANTQPLLVNTRGEIKRVFSGYTGKASVVTVSTGGHCLAVASGGRAITIWQENSGRPQNSILVYRKKVTNCVLTQDGNILVAGFNDGTIRTLCVTGGSSPAWEHRRHKKGITSLKISVDGSLLLSAGWDHVIRLWDARTGELVRTLGREAGEVTGIALLAGDSVIAAGYSGGHVRLYHRDTGENINSFPMHAKVKGIAADSSGTTLLCAGADGSMRFWNSGERDLVSCEKSIPLPRCMAFLCGKEIVMTGGWDGLLRLWSFPEGMLIETFSGHTSIITCCTASPDGDFIVTGSNDRTVRIWSRGCRDAVRINSESNSEVGALAISTDVRLLAAAGSDAVIRMYTLPGGELDYSLPGIIGSATALAFSPDSRILTAGYNSGTVLIISCPERRIVRTIHAHSAAVTAIAIPDDGKNLITGGKDGIIRTWDFPVATTLAGKTIGDIATVSRLAHSASSGIEREQWGFLHAMLAARFRNAIELCEEREETGMFDIQIVG
jgi:WD40 repeat protein